MSRHIVRVRRVRSTKGIVPAISSLVLGIVLTVTGQAQVRVPVNESGTTSLEATFGKSKVTVSIQTVRIDRSNVLFPADDLWDLAEVSVVKNVEIFVNGRPVIVPRGAFTELFGPRIAHLRLENRMFVLQVNGLDAANSYFDRIFFNASSVTRSTFYSSLFPDKPASITNYNLNTLGDR